MNLQDEYRYFLSLCDGGYTKDCFFHFFGQKGPPPHNILEWNQIQLWKKYYDLDDSTFVFAEDIFGNQFYFDIRGNRRVVKMLIPDGGKLSLFANTFEEFVQAEVLVDAVNSELRELARKVFNTTGTFFRPYTHISCKIPSSLGGDDRDLTNLEIIEARAHLKLLGQINVQIKSLPPGTKIRDIKTDRQTEQILLIPEDQD